VYLNIHNVLLTGKVTNSKQFACVANYKAMAYEDSWSKVDKVHITPEQSYNTVKFSKRNVERLIHIISESAYGQLPYELIDGGKTAGLRTLIYDPKGTNTNDQFYKLLVAVSMHRCYYELPDLGSNILAWDAYNKTREDPWPIDLMLAIGMSLQFNAARVANKDCTELAWSKRQACGHRLYSYNLPSNVGKRERLLELFNPDPIESERRLKNIGRYYSSDKLFIDNDTITVYTGTYQNVNKILTHLGAEKKELIMGPDKTLLRHILKKDGEEQFNFPPTGDAPLKNPDDDDDDIDEAEKEEDDDDL